MDWIWMGFYHGAAMLWSTLWALVLGFGLSALMQVFLRREQVMQRFGRADLKSVAFATGFGAASSSCSYAAAAMARTAFEKGAAFVPMLAFMFASTNLVIELGVVLWLLMGWQFVMAEVVGSFVLISVMWLLVSLIFPAGLAEEARRHTQADEKSCRHRHNGHAARTTFQQVADAFVMDWTMLWKEIAAGFLISGYLSALVPNEWWAKLFMSSGPPAARLVENAIVGPIIAVLSFVCSVGNIPLASLLWGGGISFGGVISFIYADLIVIPLLIIYGKYYGAKAAAYISGVMFASIVIAGIVVDLLFGLFGLIPSGPRPVAPVAHATFHWNYTTWLDIAAIVVGGWLLFLHFSSSTKDQPMMGQPGAEHA